MSFILRRLAPLIVVLVSVAALPMSWTLSVAAFTLSANTTALIMGGSFHPLVGPRDTPDFVRDYLDNAVSGYLDPAFALVSGQVTNPVAVFTPEDFFPLGRLTFENSVAEGLANLRKCIEAQPDCEYNDDPAVYATTVAPHGDDTMMVFGYSQSSVIASLAKRDLTDGYQPGDPVVPFMLTANPMRPNGGVLMRLAGWPTIPILGIPFPGASPINSAELDGGGFAYPTVDVALQYDGLGGDFPVRALNLIATLNALAGYVLMHGGAVDMPLSQARFQGREGDTSYYLIETDLVPLLQPFRPFIPKPILTALDAPLRVIIEEAYDRDVGPGVPTPADWRPIKDLGRMALRLLASVPVAVDNFVEDFGFTRVLGTSRPGTFGVGGPVLGAEPDEVNGAAEMIEPGPVSVGTRRSKDGGDAATADAAQEPAPRDQRDVEPGEVLPRQDAEGEPEPDEDISTDAAGGSGSAPADPADHADQAADGSSDTDADEAA